MKKYIITLILHTIGTVLAAIGGALAARGVFWNIVFAVGIFIVSESGSYFQRNKISDE